MFFLKYILNYPAPTSVVILGASGSQKNALIQGRELFWMWTWLINDTSILFMYLPLISLVFIWGNHHRWTERTNYKDTGVQWLRVWAQNLEWSGFIHGSMTYCLGELPAEPQFPLWNRYNHSIHLQNCPTMKWNDAQKYSAQFLACIAGTQNMLVVFLPEPMTWAGRSWSVVIPEGCHVLWTCLSHKPVPLVKTLCLLLGSPNCKILWLLRVCISLLKIFFKLLHI